MVIEGIGYGMIGWVIPLERLSRHLQQAAARLCRACRAEELQFALSDLRLRFEGADAEAQGRIRRRGQKLDMGKSCIRFKKADELALSAIRDEIASTTPEEFIRIYEARTSGSC